MRYREFLKEDNLAKLKQTVAGKIVALPDIPQVAKTLEEIEGILSYVNAGGKMASIKGELVQIADPEVAKSHKLLAKYIASIEMTPKQREELFAWWKDDKLVDRKALLSGKIEPLSKIFKGYDTNPAIREFVDDLSGISALGQGKGEFLLSVLSRGISKMGKGDLRIDDLAVEVKTLDKGAGRFFDQEVKPASEYNTNRDAFYEKYGSLKPSSAAAGLRIDDLVEIGNKVDDKKAYKKDLNAVLQSLFPGENIKDISDAIIAGSIGKAKQLYAQVNLAYYINVKTKAEALDGILYIDLASKPMTMMFFNDVKDLEKEGVRLHASTTYPVTNDVRNAYPQIRIITSGRSVIDTDTTTAKKDKETAGKGATETKPTSATKTATKAAPAPKAEPAPAPKMRVKKK